MRILLLTDYYPPDKVGGVGEIVLNLARAYRELGHHTTVLTTGLTKESGVIRSGTSLARGVFTNNLKAVELIRRGKIDLVHLHQSSTTLFLLLRPFMRQFPFALNSLQVSYVSEARHIRVVHAGGRTFRPLLRERIEQLIFAPVHVALDALGCLFSDRTTAVSRENQEEVRRTFGRLTRSPVEVVPNGGELAPASLGRFRDAALEERLRGRLVITYVGVLRTRKRVMNLLLALRDLAPDFPDIRLLVVGGGRGYGEPLRALAAELGVKDRAEFVGSVPRERVSYYLSLSDIFCILSSYEGMPVAMLEAMGRGLPVVATDRYGMKDLLATSGGGIGVPLDDIPATVTALKTLIQDAELRQRFGESNRRSVATHFDWTEVARRYLKLVPI